MEIKNIILYGRRTPCWIALYHLKDKGYNIKVVSDDRNVLFVAQKLGIEVRSFEERGFCDLFICIHGTRILTKHELGQSFCVNIHPALELYRGKNPIGRYIENKNIDGSVSSHFMTEIVDAGKIIDTQYFETPICNSHADFYNIAYIHYINCLDETLKKIIENKF